MLRFNLMLAVLLVALLFFGSSNGTYSVAYTEGYHFIVINGMKYYVPEHNELSYYADRTPTPTPRLSTCKETDSVGFCRDHDSATSNCYPDKIGLLHKLCKLDPSLGQWYFNMYKLDVIAYFPKAGFASSFYTDIVTFNFPIYSLFSDSPFFKIMITVDTHGVYDGCQVIFEDPQNSCPGYSVSQQKLLNFNSYVNKKWNKHAYYLIKSGSKICAYTLKHEDLFHLREIRDRTPPTIHHLKFDLINAFESEYYAPNFYCVDPIYGTFVTFYWDKQPGHPPEAHFYIINENNLQNFYLVDRMSLTGFNEDILRAIFANEFDNTFYPVFQSYGRQIFIWFKFRNGNRAFHGLWSGHEGVYKVFFESIPSSPDKQKIWYARKDYIRYDQPVGRYRATSLPPQMIVPGIEPLLQTSQEPTTLPTTTKATTLPPPTTTLKATTTAERTTTTTTLLPSTTTTKKTTVLPSTTAAAPSTPGMCGNEIFKRNGNRNGSNFAFPLTETERNLQIF